MREGELVGETQGGGDLLDAEQSIFEQAASAGQTLLAQQLLWTAAEVLLAEPAQPPQRAAGATGKSCQAWAARRLLGDGGEQAFQFDGQTLALGQQQQDLAGEQAQAPSVVGRATGEQGEGLAQTGSQGAAIPWRDHIAGGKTEGVQPGGQTGPTELQPAFMQACTGRAVRLRRAVMLEEDFARLHPVATAILFEPGSPGGDERQDEILAFPALHLIAGAPAGDAGAQDADRSRRAGLGAEQLHLSPHALGMRHARILGPQRTWESVMVDMVNAPSVGIIQVMSQPRTASPALASCLLTVCTALSAVEAKPNIVLVMTDDQGLSDIGYNRALNPQGAKLVTPELDRLAGEGLRLDRAYAAAPVCSPTRAAVLTGRHPYRYGVWCYGDPLRAQERSLAQDLAAAGYATGHFGKWHLEGQRGPGTAVAADNPLGPSAFGFQEWRSLSNFFETDPVFGSAKGPVQGSGDGSEAVAEQANAFIAAAAKAKRPFLAVLWFGSPHVPHQPLPADLQAAGGNAKFGELLGVDRAVGSLRAQLAKAGVERDTLIWYTSDNGSDDSSGCGGLRGKKGSVYEGGLRVPGILHWPERIKPGRSALPVVSSDIRPTVLALCGAKDGAAGRPGDGVDLSPLIAGKAMGQRPPICFWYEGKGKVKKPEPDRGSAAILDGSLKLHRTPKGWELYDLAADPAEARNLAEKQPNEVERLRALLETWQTSVVASYAGKDYAGR